MNRPREFLDRRKVRRGLCDRELREFRPRRLDPPHPEALKPGTGLPLLPDPPEPDEEPGTTLTVTAAELAPALDSMGHPGGYDLKMRGGTYVVTFRRTDPS
jgi:hypothetical protein